MTDTKRVLAVLEQAKCLEQEGQEFYRKAAESTANAKGKEMFLNLAREEVLHERLIQREMDSLKASGEWVKLAEATGVKCDLSQPIFPRGRAGLKKAVRADATDTEALLTALEMETKSYDLYRKEAEAAKDAAAREMYEFLASQERTHFDLLMINYESLVQFGGWAD